MINSEEDEQNANPLLQILDEDDLERNLDDGDDAVDDVELVGEVDDVAVEDAGDDGEDHVHESEHGGETKQLDVLEVRSHFNHSWSPLITSICCTGLM